MSKKSSLGLWSPLLKLTIKFGSFLSNYFKIGLRHSEFHLKRFHICELEAVSKNVAVFFFVLFFVLFCFVLFCFVCFVLFDYLVVANNNFLALCHFPSFWPRGLILSETSHMWSSDLKRKKKLNERKKECMNEWMGESINQ